MQLIIITLGFLVYFFAAAKPVPRETVLSPRWISSLNTNTPIDLRNRERSSPAATHTENDNLIPFTLGHHFGYVDTSGHFEVNRINPNEIALSNDLWTEYSSEPNSIEIKNIAGNTVINIQNIRGYPVLLDGRIFIFGSEQNSLSEIDTNGNVIWTYEFGSILTDFDAAAGLVAAVTIDGILEILDSQGRRIFFYQPGGSRMEVIYGCAISRNGSRVGIISGYDPQRFIILEKFGIEEGEYRVIYHEFLDRGFRRPVKITFIDDDRRVFYERQGGIGIYNINSRRSMFIPLNGELTIMDETGKDGWLFLITRQINQPEQRELVGLRLPRERGLNKINNAIFLKTPFKNDDVFLARTQTSNPRQSMLVIGGGSALICFDIEER